MDILNRKLLKNGDSCYFYVSSVESPYIYLKFRGTINEVSIVNNEQTIYRINVEEVLEDELNHHNYINRNSFRVFDLNSNTNRTKRFYTFQLENYKKFIAECVDKKYLFECPSASVFENKNQMLTELKGLNKYIKSILLKTVKEINLRN